MATASMYEFFEGATHCNDSEFDKDAPCGDGGKGAPNGNNINGAPCGNCGKH